MTRKEIITLGVSTFLGTLTLTLVFASGGCKPHSMGGTTPIVIEVLTDDCVKIAKVHGRDDIVDACQMARTGSELLRLIMVAQESRTMKAQGPVCPLPEKPEGDQ